MLTENRETISITWFVTEEMESRALIAEKNSGERLSMAGELHSVGHANGDRSL
tara:strand:+ start:10 stop:168 length:159 start_codon:yes stop_codon:yes gene_type:complete